MLANYVVFTPFTDPGIPTIQNGPQRAGPVVSMTGELGCAGNVRTRALRALDKSEFGAINGKLP